jgi:hypothetical protein
MDDSIHPVQVPVDDGSWTTTSRIVCAAIVCAGVALAALPLLQVRLPAPVFTFRPARSTAPRCLAGTTAAASIRTPRLSRSSSPVGLAGPASTARGQRPRSTAPVSLW